MPFLGALLVLAAVGATSRAATLDDSFWVIVNDLARSGRFEDVLAHLRQGGEPLENLGASSLVRDLELQQQNELHRREEQHNALEQKLQEMETELREGKLHEALAAALEAQDLADVPESMLADDRVTDLIRQAEDATDAAKQIGAWVEVTGVYRALDILHEKSAVSYRDKLKNAVQHVRALRLYAPQRVHELIADRARHERLVGLADAVAGRFLRTGGHLLVKLFSDSEDWFRQLAGGRFERSATFRPASTRKGSREIYGLALAKVAGPEKSEL